MAGSKDATDILLELVPQIAEFGTKLDNIKETVEKLSKIVVDGNGHSLVTRMALVEEEVSAIQSTNNSKDNTKLEKRNANVQVYATIICSVLALAASIIAIIYG